MDAPFEIRNITLELRGCGGCLTAYDTVLSECTGQCEFTEPVANHVLSNEDVDESLAVVDIESMPYEIGGYHRAAGPGLNRSLHSALVHFFNLFEETCVCERAFFN